MGIQIYSNCARRPKIATGSYGTQHITSHTHCERAQKIEKRHGARPNKHVAVLYEALGRPNSILRRQSRPPGLQSNVYHGAATRWTASGARRLLWSSAVPVGEATRIRARREWMLLGRQIITGGLVLAPAPSQSRSHELCKGGRGVSCNSALL